jgi:predicted MFS family arabinose efflux permease
MLNARAPSYPVFLVTRASTGIDDSSYSGLESMVGDFFEPKIRSKVYGLLKIAPSIGYLLAMILAMTLAGSLGWRNLYLITGSVGIMVAILIYFGVKDPPRGSSEPEMAKLKKVVVKTFTWQTVKEIFRKPTMIFLFLSGFFGVFPWQVLVFWIFRYLETERHFTSTEITLTMVGVILVMTVGYAVSGAFADFAFKKTPRGRLIVSIIGFIFAFAFLMLALTSSQDSHMTFSVLLIVGAFFMTFPAPQTPATVTDVVLPEIRSTALSVQYLIENSGAALAPFLAGLIAIRSSLGSAMIVIAFAWVFALILIACAAYFVPRDSAVLRDEMQTRALEQSI